jgi:hypothetical protein
LFSASLKKLSEALLGSFLEMGFVNEKSNFGNLINSQIVPPKTVTAKTISSGAIGVKSIDFEYLLSPKSYKGK